jgi:DNA-binding MarR family transcriptional regulator
MRHASADAELDRVMVEWAEARPKLEVSAKPVVYAIWYLANRLTQAADRVLDEHGLTFGEYGVLAMLIRAGKPHQLSPGQLVAGLGLTSGGMSNILERLESKRLLRRRRAGQDRRSVTVSLTAVGVALADRLVEEVAEEERRAVGRLSPAERTDIERLLRKLLRGFEQSSIEVKTVPARRPRLAANGS